MMFNTTRVLPLLLLPVILSSCSNDMAAPEVPGTPPRALTKSESRVISGSNGFGLRLFARMNQESPDTNLFISPLSVSMALGMTNNGARSATADSMARVLGFEGMDQQEINDSYKWLIGMLGALDPSVSFQLANSIWYRTGLDVRPDFVTRSKEYFNAEVRGLDFSDATAGPTINAWVKENTRGKIEKIVPEPIPGNAVMYLINAIYFKGDWGTKFDPKETRDGEFHLADGGTVPCKMMSRTGKIAYAETERFKLVDLPYGKEGRNYGYSMTLVLPKETETIDGLIAALGNGDSSILTTKPVERELPLSMPKFKIEFERNLNDLLIALGMGIAYSPSADLSGIGGDPGGLVISNVIHKSMVDVNEEGTEAAAATSVEVVETSAGPGFVADRPFIFMIRERHSGTILFIGKMMRPGS